MSATATSLPMPPTVIELDFNDRPHDSERNFERMCPLTKQDIRCFTSEWCGTLAKKLHRLTGWPIYTFNSILACHIFVVAPTGHAVDVRGLQSISQMRRRWKCWRYYKRPLKEIERHPWGTTDDADVNARARAIAPYIVAEAQRKLRAVHAPGS